MTEALAALREAVDIGWRPILDVPLAHDPSLRSLWEEADFKAMLGEIEADMATQLERVGATPPEAELLAMWTPVR